MTTRLVAFLGLGPKKEALHYEEVSYRFGERAAAKTPLMMSALCELFGPVDGVLVLGTREVRERWVDTGLLAEKLSVRWDFREVAAGRTQEECWKLFGAVREALEPVALPALGEAEAPARILVDLTHGFRAQPLLGMAALGYVLSEWKRANLSAAPDLTLLYGAFEAREGDTAPVWDLTPFVTATQWNNALDALMRYGRADDLEALGAHETRRQVDVARHAGATGKALSALGTAKRFGALARTFADDLSLARFPQLLTGLRVRDDHAMSAVGSARKLLDFLGGDDARALESRLPVLRDSLARLRAWLAPLQADRIESREGVRALAALAGLCGQLQRYSEQIAAVREGLVSLDAITRGRPIASEPGASGYHDARVVTERDLSARRDESDPLADAFRQIAQPRNDIHHGGLNAQPLDAKKLREQLERLSERFRAQADEPRAE